MFSLIILLLGGVAAVFAVALVVVFLRFGQAAPDRSEVDGDLTIDLNALPHPGVSPTGPLLECYGTPVRLMVLVIAPAGRQDPPAKEDLSRIAEFLLPGLMTILEAHQPIFRLWPQQLSTTGFQHVFFNNLQLPGDHGKGTPWCSVVGRFHADGHPYLAGFVCAADHPNGLSEITVEHDGRWLDVLRIRTSQATR